MKLSPHLHLPADVVTRTLAILAQKGAGKTYTAMKLAELMLEESMQIVALDPTGVWWGLRADKEGKPGRGLDVIVMGGDHGDVPLEPTAGEIVADFITQSGRSVVLDLSHFESNAAQNRFVTTLALKLYRLKAHSRTPLHLMLDEADSFAPQRPQPGEQAMLGAFEAIVRRGRSRGLGMTMISQRPACLNKNVLTQIDALICHRVTGKQDMDALTDWVKHWQGGKDQTALFLQSLPALEVGECWFWSPGWTGNFIRSKVNKRQTYDSSRTPEAGMALPSAQLKPVDISGLSEQIRASVERAKASDPAELKRQIAKLDSEVRRLQQEKPKEIEKTVEVPVLTQGDHDVLQKLASFFQSNPIQETLAKIMEHLFRQSADKSVHAPVMQIGPKGARALLPAPVRIPPPSVRVSHKPAESPGKLSKCERAILTVLAQSHGGPCSKRKIACISGYAINGGGFNNALSALRGRNCITGGDPCSITQQGIDELGSFTPRRHRLRARLRRLGHRPHGAGIRRQLPHPPPGAPEAPA